MGFLTVGNTFAWEESCISPIDYVHQHGILQFLSIWKRFKDRSKDVLKWGDEIEYIVLSLDAANQEAKLNLRGNDILDELAKEEESGEKVEFLWGPEYARYMIEGTPGAPYGGDNGLNDLLRIEQSMKIRREKVLSMLRDDEMIITMSNYPLLGASGQFLNPHHPAHGPVALSLFTPDEIINRHQRFKTLTQNIRIRRGSNVRIEVPLFQDSKTTKDPLPLPMDNTASGYPNPPPGPGVIYMDSMAFGMGCCCLQMTLQCANIDEARYFYDQFTVLSPIMLALTASAPIYRGYLADWDVRWNVICGSVDDRTPEERGLKPLKNSKYVIPKSRYGSVDCYISQNPNYKSEYNDLNLVYDKEAYQHLRSEGLDELLAKHIAHLFIRDPLVIYRDKLMIEDSMNGDHFENIQSTNWQTVRFKLPTHDGSIGWRVEFRPCDVQFTDFENSAYTIFIILFTRIVNAFELNLYIPLSKVEENMATAHKRDAIKQSKFFFRKYIKGEKIDDSFEEMTIDEIINGKTTPDGRFHGLLELMRDYLDTIHLESSMKIQLQRYLNFIGERASGKLISNSTFIRNFVENHASYQRDSVVTPKINYDLMQVIAKIGNGQLAPPELYGDYLNRNGMA